MFFKKEANRTFKYPTKIAIIGGSIAGCSIGALLNKEMPEVNFTIFESSKELHGRGAGIILPNDLVKLLIEKDILDETTPRLSIEKRTIYCKTSDTPHYGKTLWTQRFSGTSMHWDVLFDQLRRRIPNHQYKAGQRVTEVILEPKKNPTVILENGRRRYFDLVIFADGYRSFGRKHIDPNITVKYAEYVAWRGTIPYTQLPKPSPFIKNVPYYFFNSDEYGGSGHLLCYPILHKGIKILNWVFYETMTENKATTFCNGNQFSLNEKGHAHLHQLAEKQLPNVMADAVKKTQKPFMQQIVSTNGLKKLTHHQAVMIGDTLPLRLMSVVVQPVQY